MPGRAGSGMGMGAMPMGGGGARGGGGDTEHHRDVPLEDDLFDDERIVTPPVIGADEDD